jgi:hydroxypyruvate reductase
VSAAALRADALACHAAALAAVAPAALVARRLGRDGAALVLRDGAGGVVGRHAGPVLLVGAGKAGLAMARAAATAADAACVGGLVVVPHGGGGPGPGRVEVATAAHPLPDAAGVAATERLLAAVAAAGRGTLVLVVLSGGASSLLVAPAAGLALADKAEVTARLLEAGAHIAELNAVRKHCSRVKGGGLARGAAGAAAVWALLLSDVPGDDPATIGSGPTVADPTTFADAAAVLARRLRPADVPAAVRAHLARGVAGAVPETLKPGDPALARATAVVVGGNRDAVAAAAAAAAARGYATDVVAEPLGGDAARAGRALVARLRAAPRDRPVAVVAGGETTVRVRPGGRGGRSQQLALAAALALAGEPAVLLAVGTDGVDGPTDAAGACVDGATAARAAARGLDAERALAATDSYPLLAATGDLLRTGPTGTNVADLVVALRAAW